MPVRKPENQNLEILHLTYGYQSVAVKYEKIRWLLYDREIKKIWINSKLSSISDKGGIIEDKLQKNIWGCIRYIQQKMPRFSSRKKLDCLSYKKPKERSPTVSWNEVVSPISSQTLPIDKVKRLSVWPLKR